MVRFLKVTFLMLLISGFRPPQKTQILLVTISGIKKQKGAILVALHNKESSFTDDPKSPFMLQKLPLPKGSETTSLKFKNVPEGEYAVSVLQDENDNKKMDFSGLGIPKEGFGVSNPSGSKYSKPKYEKSKFTLNATHNHITIQMMYF